MKEQGLIDDLQYEEVAAEFKRSGKPIMQILQDFGILDMDSILQAMANHLATEVVDLKTRQISPELVNIIPAKTARMYECMPVGTSNGSVQIALVDPLVSGTWAPTSIVASGAPGPPPRAWRCNRVRP